MMNRDGAYWFPTGMADEQILIYHDLSPRHVEFLNRNPAAVRCCLVQGEFTMSWLDALMASVATIDASGAEVRTWH